jgi:dolichol-phosphate mannosyltransferase
MKLSVVTPAFNEAANLRGLYDRLVATMQRVGVEWEWIVVDDHSRDDTFRVVGEMAVRDPRIRGVRLSRNCGSHTAIACGLHLVTGAAAVVLAADMQDPPEVVSSMLERWRSGAQVVWAVRRTRPGDRSHTGFAALYYWVMRNPVGLLEMPAHGADFFLVDKVVIDAFRQVSERNTSVLALVTWLGFRQEQIEYDKLPRQAGQSGWTVARKIRLVVDSVTSFSNFPIRACSIGGAVFLAIGLALFLVSLGLLSAPGAGIFIILGVVIALAGVQLMALGIIGEYVWRALDEARKRPAYFIEAAVGRDTGTRGPVDLPAERAAGL